MPLKLIISKKVVPDFRHRENIHFDREILPPDLNYELSLPITFLKMDTWNMICGFTGLNDFLAILY